MATATAATQPTGTAREYETIYIMRGNVEPSAAETVSTRTAGVIEQNGGRLLKVDNWGRRRLAYPIAGHARGAFVYVRYVGGPQLVRELERNLAMLDEVVRWQTMLLRRNVAAADYQVSEDDLRYEALETDVPDEEPGLAQRLGLVDRPGPIEDDPGRYDRDPAEDEDAGDEEDE